jgi:hypothetical protein
VNSPECGSRSVVFGPTQQGDVVVSGIQEFRSAFALT